MLCFENAAGQIVSHGQYVRLLWHTGERKDEDIIEALNKVLEVGKELQISRLLIDQQFMQTCSVEVEVWFKYDWLTRARLQFDFGAAAILSGRHLLVRLATTVTLKYVIGWTGNFQIRLFDHWREPEAIAWLLQPNPKA